MKECLAVLVDDLTYDQGLISIQVRNEFNIAVFLDHSEAALVCFSNLFVLPPILNRLVDSILTPGVHCRLVNLDLDRFLSHSSLARISSLTHNRCFKLLWDTLYFRDEPLLTIAILKVLLFEGTTHVARSDMRRQRTHGALRIGRILGEAVYLLLGSSHFRVLAALFVLSLAID